MNFPPTSNTHKSPTSAFAINNIWNLFFFPFHSQCHHYCHMSGTKNSTSEPNDMSLHHHFIDKSLFFALAGSPHFFFLRTCVFLYPQLVLLLVCSVRRFVSKSV